MDGSTARARDAFEAFALSATTTTTVPRQTFVPFNTHTNSTANAGELALIAREVGDEAASARWRALFASGVRGLFWVARQPWMWGAPPRRDPHEINYERNALADVDYSAFMAIEWLPHVTRLAQTLAPSDVPGLVALIRRQERARYFEQHPEWRQRYREVLAELSASGAAGAGP